LDVTAGENLMKVMSDLVSNEKCGFIIATHNPKIAEIADRTLYLNEGILSSS
jgi:ABC-type lipoprotein export system ATPase subunit